MGVLGRAPRQEKVEAIAKALENQVGVVTDWAEIVQDSLRAHNADLESLVAEYMNKHKEAVDEGNVHLQEGTAAKKELASVQQTHEVLTRDLERAKADAAKQKEQMQADIDRLRAELDKARQDAFDELQVGGLGARVRRARRRHRLPGCTNACVSVSERVWWGRRSARAQPRSCRRCASAWPRRSQTPAPRLRKRSTTASMLSARGTMLKCSSSVRRCGRRGRGHGRRVGGRGVGCQGRKAERKRGREGRKKVGKREEKAVVGRSVSCSWEVARAAHEAGAVYADGE